MDSAVLQMLGKYRCESLSDYRNALKELIQELALLGLWRQRFFEHASFYGGTALRILYGLDRFSEDLDFSLGAPNPSFDFSAYNQAIKVELKSLGFDVNVKSKNKGLESTVKSAFIKGNTMQMMLEIQVPNDVAKLCHSKELTKIKVEVDTDPPAFAETESRLLLFPSPFSVKTYTAPNLFAGKLHAVLCRQWKNRVKGRDWFDFVWFVAKGIPVNLDHLKARMVQSGHFSKTAKLDLAKLKSLLNARILGLDIAKAKSDVEPFLKDQRKTELWSHEFFLTLVNQVRDVDFVDQG